MQQRQSAGDRALLTDSAPSQAHRQCQSARDRASSTDSSCHQDKWVGEPGDHCRGASKGNKDVCRTGRLLAGGLVNPITNWKTTKQNGTMTKANQNQRMSNRQGSRGPPLTQKPSPSSNSIFSSVQRASISRPPSFTNRLSSFASLSCDAAVSIDRITNLTQILSGLVRGGCCVTRQETKLQPTDSAPSNPLDVPTSHLEMANLHQSLRSANKGKSHGSRRRHKSLPYITTVVVPNVTTLHWAYGLPYSLQLWETGP